MGRSSANIADKTSLNLSNKLQDNNLSSLPTVNNLRNLPIGQQPAQPSYGQQPAQPSFGQQPVRPTFRQQPDQQGYNQQPFTQQGAQQRQRTASASSAAASAASMVSGLAGKFGNGNLVPIVGGVVAVVAVIAIGSMLLPSSLKLSLAMNSTAKQMSSELTEIVESMPVYDFFKNWEKDEYGMNCESANVYAPKVKISMDVSAKQFRAYAFDSDIWLEFCMSEKYSTLSSSEFSKDYGIVHDTLIQDLNDCVYLDLDLDENMDLFEYDDSLSKEMEKIYTDAFKTMIKEAEVEKTKGDDLRIDGKWVEPDTYEVELTTRGLETALDGMLEDILKNESVMNYMDQVLMYNQLETMINYGYSENYDTEDMVEDFLGEFFDELVNEYDYMRDQYIIVQVYKGKVVRVASPDENVSIYVTSLKDMVSKIVLESYGDSISYGIEVDDDVCTMFYVDYWGDEYSIVYEYKERRDNVIMKEYGREVATFTIDTTEKNELDLIIPGEFSVYITKNDLDSKWFDQDDKFERILEYSENEFYSFMDEANF